MTVLIVGKIGPRPPSKRAAARRSDMLAASTRLAIGMPNVSTRICRFLPLIRLMGVKTPNAPFSVVLTDCPSMIATEGVARRSAFRRVRGYNERRSVSHTDSCSQRRNNSTPSAKVEIHAATHATDSQSEANRKWRSLQPVHQCFGDDPQVSLPGLSNPPTPIAPPSNPLRMSSFLSPKFGGAAYILAW